MKAARTRALHRKHAGTAKHASTAKHTPTAHRRAATAHKQTARRTAAAVKAAHLRAWSPDEDVALCSARAVAESFRIALGRPVSDSAVLDLFWRAGGSEDGGVSILAALEASRDGLILGEQVLAEEICEPLLKPVPEDLFLFGRLEPHALIIGLDLPWGEPHAVCAGPDGTWWSWGEPHGPDDFPGAVVEEAWAVQWQ